MAAMKEKNHTVEKYLKNEEKIELISNSNSSILNILAVNYALRADTIREIPVIVRGFSNEIDLLQTSHSPQSKKTLKDVFGQEKKVSRRQTIFLLDEKGLYKNVSFNLEHIFHNIKNYFGKNEISEYSATSLERKSQINFSVKTNSAKEETYFNLIKPSIEDGKYCIENWEGLEYLYLPFDKQKQLLITTNKLPGEEISTLKKTVQIAISCQQRHRKGGFPKKTEIVKIYEDIQAIMTRKEYSKIQKDVPRYLDRKMIENGTDLQTLCRSLKKEDPTNLKVEFGGNFNPEEITKLIEDVKSYLSRNKK